MQVAKRIKGSVCSKQYGYEDLLSPLIAKVTPLLSNTMINIIYWLAYKGTRQKIFRIMRAGLQAAECRAKNKERICRKKSFPRSPLEPCSSWAGISACNEPQ